MGKLKVMEYIPGLIKTNMRESGLRILDMVMEVTFFTTVINLSVNISKENL